MLDVWSISHFASGVVLGLLVAACKLSRCAALLVVLIFLVGWELFELLGHSRGWSWGAHDWWVYESWENRWVSDLGVGVLGAALAYTLATQCSRSLSNYDELES